MNTSGYIRGYMAKNMKAEKFVSVVALALNKEFEEIKNGVRLEKTNEKFVVIMDEYSVSLSKELIDK